MTEDRQSYIGRWHGPNTDLVIGPGGTVEYRHEEIVGDTTNTASVSGPIDSFDGASFVVGVLGNNTRFDVTEPPSAGDAGRMTVNGERLERA